MTMLIDALHTYYAADPNRDEQQINDDMLHAMADVRALRLHIDDEDPEWLAVTSMLASPDQVDAVLEWRDDDYAWRRNRKKDKGPRPSVPLIV